MKTLKFALIAAFIAFTMVSLTNADSFKNKPKPNKVVNLTLQKAVQIPGLVIAMFAQIDKEDFLSNTQHTFVAEVVYKGALYRISGTYEQWIVFFKIKGELPFNTKYIGIGIN